MIAAWLPGRGSGGISVSFERLIGDFSMRSVGTETAYQAASWFSY